MDFPPPLHFFLNNKYLDRPTQILLKTHQKKKFKCKNRKKKKVLLLHSALFERFSVSRLRHFFNCCIHKINQTDPSIVFKMFITSCKITVLCITSRFCVGSLFGYQHCAEYICILNKTKKFGTALILYCVFCILYKCVLA